MTMNRKSLADTIRTKIAGQGKLQVSEATDDAQGDPNGFAGFQVLDSETGTEFTVHVYQAEERSLPPQTAGSPVTA